LKFEILEIRARIQLGTSRPPARGAEGHRPFDSNPPFASRPNYAVLGSVLAALLFAGSATAAQPTATPSGRTWESDGSAANIQRIHDRQASDGDTIVIPAGTFSWTGTLRLTKAIILKGQTIRNDDGTSIDNTIIQDNIPLAANNGLIELNAPGGQRVTGITFVQGRTQMQSNGIIRVTGTTPTRIDHCVFDHVYFSPMIGVSDYNYGVIDHNTKRHPISNEGLVHFAMGFQSGTHGDPPWMLPAGYGGPDFFFVEDNLSYGGMDLTLGSKVVVRHNRFVYANMASHGTGQSFHDGRAARAVEIYNNQWQLAQNYYALTGSTGGGVVVHDNRIVPLDGVVDGISMQVYRMIYNFGSPFFGANGASPWDFNATEPNGSHVDGHPPHLFASGTITSATGSTITDSTKNWSTNRWRGYSIRRPSDGATAVISSNTNHTLSIGQFLSQGFAVGNTYEIRKVIQVLDQPGLGAQVGAMNRNNPRWMHQATEPCYSWNNRDQNNNLVNFTTGNGGTTIIQGRDYFNNTPMPGYTPYTYPHPLVADAGRAVVADFNGDGSPDFVLQNPSMHQTAIWYLNNNVLLGGDFGPTLPDNWGLRSATDFNRDSHSDYALFNPITNETGIWYLSGPILIASAYGPSLPNGWEFVATADFNGDGNSDYVLYNASTRQTAIWYLNNNVWIGSAYGPTLPNGWNLIGVADFDRDGHMDYALFHPQTGLTAIWYLSGPTLIGGAQGPTVASDWILVATADFNGDGYPDYVLYNAGTRQTVIWYLSNNSYVNSADGPTIPANWSLITP